MVSKELIKAVKEFYEEIGAPYDKDMVDYEELYRQVDELSSTCSSLMNDLEEEGFGY